LIGHVPTRVIVRSDEFQGLFEDALDHAVAVDGVPAPVIEPEYLVAMGMLSGRRSHDEPDVHHLVLIDDFDSPRAEAILREHLWLYAVRVYRDLVAEAVFLLERRADLERPLAELRAENPTTPEAMAWARRVLGLEKR